ncbi:MAG: response regulator [Anaerolineae bacterium]|nr:response regulator [Anaerolineae bacterium]MBT7072288.1 response regulator [Anaerolineae bacterium]MBT7326105.1 response regulator [Anaerolineae bacterium]MBT7601770.1 response regulator [Anaerolineae bacterium]
MVFKTVLVIDKDVITRKFLKHMLEEKGHAVSQAESGREGLVLAWRDQPDVIVADPNFLDLDAAAFVQKIRQDPRTAFTPIIALSSNLDKEFSEDLLAEGYNHYLQKSGNAITELLKIFEETSTDFQEKTGKRENAGKVFTFLSAKGGTGTSSLCANIAMNIAIAEPEAKVVVVDMVLPIGSLGSIVGYEGSIDLTTITDLPQEEITIDFLDKSLPRIELWNFHLLAGAPNPEASNLLQVQNISHILKTLEEIFDYIIIDLGRSLSRISLPIIQKSDLLILILGTDQGTVTITKSVTEYLKTLGIDLKKLYLILNRAIGLEGITKTDAEKILDLDIKMTMPYMGGNFTTANNQSQPITHKFPNDTGAFMLRSLAKNIIEETR